MAKVEYQAKEESKRKRLSETKEKNWNSICPKEYRLKSESNGNTELFKLELNCKQLKQILAHDKDKGLILFSRISGKCKTRAIWRFIRQLWNQGHSIRAFTSSSFQRECQDAAGNHLSTEWFNKVSRCDYLFIDDVGKQPWTANTHGAWFDIVESRTSEGRPILMTTNLTSIEMSQLSTNGLFVTRRLDEYCQWIRLD